VFAGERVECCGENEDFDLKTELDSTFISYQQFGDERLPMTKPPALCDHSMDASTIQDHFDMMDNS
jgi:hypothetical protein